MGLIDIIKPMYTVTSIAINKSQQHQDKNSWEYRESNSGQLSEKQICYLFSTQPPVCLVVINITYFFQKSRSTNRNFTKSHSTNNRFVTSYLKVSHSTSDQFDMPHLQQIILLTKSHSTIKKTCWMVENDEWSWARSETSTTATPTTAPTSFSQHSCVNGLTSSVVWWLSTSPNPGDLSSNLLQCVVEITFWNSHTAKHPFLCRKDVLDVASATFFFNGPFRASFWIYIYFFLVHC